MSSKIGLCTMSQTLASRRVLQITKSMFHDVSCCVLFGWMPFHCVSFFFLFFFEIHSLFGSSNNLIYAFFFLFFSFSDELVFFSHTKCFPSAIKRLSLIVVFVTRMIGHCCREVDTAARFQVVQPSALPESAGASPSPSFFRTQVLD
jgi:hypothetical protein